MADKSFDRNQWHPVLCKTPAEADLQIADWGLKDKKIKRLNTIGTVRYRERFEILGKPPSDRHHGTGHGKSARRHSVS